MLRSLALGSVAVLLAFAALTEPQVGIPTAAAAEAEWTPVSGQPLAEPEQVYPQNGVVTVNLNGRRRTISVSGSPILARPYHEQIIGPTIHVSPGDTIRVNITNGMNEMTNIHYHGLHVSPKRRSDNVYRHIHPHTKAVSVVHIPEDHNPGTYWYHVHFHGNTSPQTLGGMSGLIVMEGLEDLLPEGMREITQRQIALTDVQHRGGRVVMKNYDPSKPVTRLVNGQLMPTTSIKPGETQLWRIANVGANMFYEVQLEDHNFHVIAEDAFPVWETWSTDRLVLPPGKRYDVLVQGGEEGTYAFKTLQHDQGFMAVVDADLATLTVEGPALEPLELPESMNSEEMALDDATIAAERTFTFSFANTDTNWARINNKPFKEARIDVEPKLGTVEEWTLVNATEEEHPFHIHVNDFQVMSIDGKPYKAKGLQDVMLLPKGSTVVIRNPFLDFPGRYVFHCHILDHEDNGMMAGIKVVP